MSPLELWRFLPLGYLLTIAIETPILLLRTLTRTIQNDIAYSRYLADRVHLPDSHARAAAVAGELFARGVSAGRRDVCAGG